MSPSNQRLISQIAGTSAVIAWLGLAYCFFAHTQNIDLGGVSHTFARTNPVGIATLVFGAIGLLCSLPGLVHDITDRSAWLFVVYCSLPFIAITSLLNPFSIW